MKSIDLLELCKNREVICKKLRFLLKIKEINNRIVVSYETGPGQMKSRPFEFPRFIELNDELFEVFGLIQAEGSKVPHSLAMSFVNSNPEYVRYVIDYFEKHWKIPRDKWSCDIAYWRNEFNNDVVHNLNKFWQHNLKLPCLLKIRHGKITRRSDTAVNCGVASLRLNSRVFYTIIMFVLNETVKKEILKNNKFLGCYFRGLFSGDGCVNSDNGRFSHISLAFNPHSDELGYYSNLLIKTGIKMEFNAIKEKFVRHIPITNWRNLLRLLEITEGRLFLDKDKNALFLNGFLEHQYVSVLLRLKELKMLNKINMQTYSETFGVCQRSSLKSLKRLTGLKLLSKSTSRPALYLITDLGQRFLNLVERLHHVLENDATTHSNSSRTCRPWQNKCT